MRSFVWTGLVSGFLLWTGTAAAGTVNVTDEATLRAALSNAKAGDEIIIADGSYTIGGANLSCPGNATPDQPILVHSAKPLGAKITLTTLEGFTVTGASWHFSDLELHGACSDDKNCEHAFHVTGPAHDFQLKKSRLVDFNAQIKVNANPASAAGTPNRGIIEGNEIFDTRPRTTDTPVTKVNIDTGDGWIVRANYIHDYQHSNGDPSYGAFMKSGSTNGTFERNLVLCVKDVAANATQIGLSFGGGGTAPEFCAPAFDANTPCNIEHTGGVMKNNIIANCNDVGIYLNRAKDTRLAYNTLIATSGIDFRFDTTSGEAHGNLLSGKIRDRDGSTHSETDNLPEIDQPTFESMYTAPLTGDLTKKGDLSSILGKGQANPDATDDYCLRSRSGQWDLGALQSSLGDCVTVPPPLGDGTAPITTSDGGASSGQAPNRNATSSGGASSGSDGGVANGASPGGNDDGGCSTSPGTATAPLLGLFVLAAIRRRRQRG